MISAPRLCWPTLFCLATVASFIVKMQESTGPGDALCARIEPDERAAAVRTIR
jgi:hypothetical protein